MCKFRILAPKERSCADEFLSLKSLQILYPNLGIPQPTSQAMMTTQPIRTPRYIIIRFTPQGTSYNLYFLIYYLFFIKIFTGQTTQFINEITGISMTTQPSTISNTNLPYNPDTCGISGYVRLWNNTCISKTDAQV